MIIFLKSENSLTYPRERSAVEKFTAISTTLNKAWLCQSKTLSIYNLSFINVLKLHGNISNKFTFFLAHFLSNIKWLNKVIWNIQVRRKVCYFAMIKLGKLRSRVDSLWKYIQEGVTAFPNSNPQCSYRY